MNAGDSDLNYVKSMDNKRTTSVLSNENHVCSGGAVNTLDGFYCGACGQCFHTICQVHEHMQGKHMSKGSYHYDSFLRTAFPKYDSVCCFTQTIHEDEDRRSDGLAPVSSCGRGSNKQAVSDEKYSYDDLSISAYKLNCVGQDGQRALLNSFKANGQYKGSKCTAEKIGVKALITGQKMTTSSLNCGTVAVSEDTKNGTEGTCNKKQKTRKRVHKVSVNQNKDRSFVNPVINDDSISVKSEDTKELCKKKSGATGLKSSKRVGMKLPSRTKKESLRRNREVINHVEGKKGKVLLEKCGSTFENMSLYDSEMKSEALEQLRSESKLCSKASELYADTKMDDPFSMFFEKQQSELFEKKGLDTQVTTVCKNLKNSTAVSKKNVSSADDHLDAIKNDTIENSGKKRDLRLPYTCEICGHVMPWSKKDVHQRLHSGERPFICELCGKGLISRNKLRRHMLIHSEVKKHTCDICGVGFQMKYKLRMHMHIHTGKKPYLCSICGAEFNHSSNLATHNRCVHLQIKPFECKVCGGKYAKRSQLDDHALSHSSDRQFTCRFCGKSFKYLKGMKRHEKNHLEEKPLKCKICNACFTDHAKFTEHVSTAHIDPPMKCTTCGKTFTDKETFDEHKATECESKKYQCAICGEGYKLCSQYYTHMLAAHGIDRDQAKMVDDQRKKTNMYSNQDSSSTLPQNFMFPIAMSDRDVTYPNSFTVTNSVLNPPLSVTQMVTGLLEENRSTIGALTRAATENLRLHSQDIPDEEKVSSVLPSMNTVIIADRNQTANYYTGSSERILIEPLHSTAEIVGSMTMNPISSSINTGQTSLLDNESSLAVGRLVQNAASVELPKVLFTGSNSEHIHTNSRNDSGADSIPAIAGYRIQNLY